MKEFWLLFAEEETTWDTFFGGWRFPDYELKTSNNWCTLWAWRIPGWEKRTRSECSSVVPLNSMEQGTMRSRA